VRSLEIERVQDASTRRIPFQKKIGAGLDLAAFEREVAAGRLRHVGLGESLHFLAHHLGFPLERWDETLAPVVASGPLTCALGPIRAGQAAGVRQVAEGWVGGVPVLRLTFQAAIGQRDPHDRVRVDGDPPLDLVLQGGVHGDVATSALLLNALPALAEARPGLHTMASVRPLRSVARLPVGKRS
jgi:4-hydroxy-tetrahydrodipicolinate reductase